MGRDFPEVLRSIELELLYSEEPQSSIPPLRTSMTVSEWISIMGNIDHSYEQFVRSKVVYIETDD